MAADHPVLIDHADAGGWLSDRFSAGGGKSSTVVWQSVVRQYVPADHWNLVEAVMGDALAAGRAVAWVTFEPGPDHVRGFELRCRERDGEHLLAHCADHGPPVD